VEAKDWDERYRTTTMVWSAGPNQFVEKELRPLPASRALDLGCGEGRNALWLAERGWDVTAVDFSAVAIEKGRNIERMRRGSGHGHGLVSHFGYISWVVGDASTYSSSKEFDVAILSYLQLPVEQRRAAVRSAFGHLRKGGVLLVIAHDSTNLTEGTGGPQDPGVLYTAADVLADLAGETFSVVKAGRVSRTVTPDETHAGEPDQIAWDALVRLTRG
jgi:SAM-dependent methyltransferase